MSKFIVVAAGDSSFLLKEAHNFLHLDSLTAVKHYDVFESNDDNDLDEVLPLFESGIVYEDLSEFDKSTTFRYRQVLGQI